MDEDPNSELERLRTALQGLEAQRHLLGEAIVGPAVNSLQEKIAVLEECLRAEEQTGVLHSRTRRQDERRIVTILFTDIVGSTAIAEKLDPEEWREQVAAVHHAAGAAIQQYGGTVLQYLGDGLLAAFGAHDPGEDDPERAVRAALEIQARLSTLQADPPIHMRVSIHTGLVLLGNLDLPAKQELTASGDAVNLAARLQSAAPPGGVLVSRDTYHYIRNLFDVTPQPALELKGKREPVYTYLVHRARPLRFHTVTRGVAGAETATIGRQSEMETLQHHYRDAIFAHTFRWTQLIGSPGIGKTRLLLDMLNFLEAQPEEIHLLRARTHPGDEHQAFSLVRRFWFNLFQIAADTPLEAAERLWTTGLLDILRQASPAPASEQPPNPEPAHSLGLLVGLPFTDSPYLIASRSDQALLKGRARVISRQLISALQVQKPVVILLEDLHWADAASWEYLTQVLPAPPDQPGNAIHPDLAHGVFVLATARPEWNPPLLLLQHPGYRSIELKSISRPAAQTLLSELLGTAQDIPQSVQDAVLDRSEGIPYFIEEMVNWMLDQGVIDQTQQPPRFSQLRWRGVVLPDTLQYLLRTRLDSLPQEERLALKCGSVFGRNFWEGGLAALGVQASHPLLLRTEARGFVQRKPFSALLNEVEWSFYHNLLSDAAYEAILKRERRRLHQAAAGWLETQARQANRLDEFSGLLAVHYDRAGLTAPAAHWYTRAGAHAKQRGALLEARSFLDRALELIPPEDLPARWEALSQHDELLGWLLDTPARLADDAALITLAQALDDDCRISDAYRRKGYYAIQLGENAEALQAFELALQAARRASDPDQEALSLGLLTHSLIRAGELGRAAETVEAAERLIQRISAEITRAMVLTNISSYYIATGEFVRAMQVLEQIVEIARHQSNFIGEAVALLNLGYIQLLLGSYDLGRTLLEQSLERCEAVGVVELADSVQLNLGLAHWRLSRLEDARQVLERVIPKFEKAGESFSAAVGYTYLGLIHEQAQELPLARKHFEHAVKALRQLNAPGYLHDALAGLARVCLALDEPKEAEAASREVWQFLTQPVAPVMELPQLAFATCARVFSRLNLSDLARQALNTGCGDIQERAARISNPELREQFLCNIPEHRWLFEAAEKNP